MIARKTSFSFSLLLTLGVLAACSGPQDAAFVDALPVIYPDYVDVTIPVGIAPLNFAMADDSVTAIDVVVNGVDGGMLYSKGACTDFDIQSWHSLLEQNRGRELNLTVCAKRDGKWTRYRDFSIHVSEADLPDWGITYRRIAPGYEMFGLMGIYERELSTFEEKSLLDNWENEGMCINCHTSNRANPDQHVFHVRGEHGATLIHTNGRDELLKAVNDSLGGTMVYPYWHPDGRYCAFSTNKTSQMFHTTKENVVEVYDSSSDVFVYDTENHQIIGDSLIMKKLWAENCPAFSPDGRWLYFVTARRQVYPTDYDKERYSLCRVSFDPATGHIGQRVDTLINAAAEGKSVSWPRPSYDGHYLMYTLADYGYFTIWHPECDLWLLDLLTGQRQPLTIVNSDRADSFHNWSSDGGWFLFTSRRDDGRYSRIYLSSIGQDGQATKPFLLPQRDPKRFYTQSLYSYNTPDFTIRPVGNDSQAQIRALKSDERIPTEMVKN
ncbi:MAG: PD40 domain-containing protein [Bacteroidales bacterium]|nr:PD40 domain-containing protein [Bacteroidales bacterium]